MSRVTALVVSLCLGALFIAGPAHAAAQITDKEGDANGINDQQGVGTSTNPTISQVLTALDDADGNGMATAPASYDPADINAVTFETTYDAVVFGNGITYVPTGISFHIATKATPKSDGPTMIYRIVGDVSGCSSLINGFIHGTQAPADDPATGLLQWRQTAAPPACPDTTAAVTDVTKVDPAWTATVGDKEIVLSFPFSAMTAAQKSYLGPGGVLSKISASVRLNVSPPRVTTPVASTKPSVTAPNIDSTAYLAGSWVIGSDVPANVPCTVGC